MARPEDGAAAFMAAARALNEAADKDLIKETYSGFRTAAKPLGAKVIREGSAKLPHRGGLSARVARARMGQSNATSGRNPGVRLTFRVKEGYDLKGMDDGTIKRPVFARPGRTRVWRQQSIRRGSFTDPFEAGAGDVEHEILGGLDKVADKIAEKTRRGAS